MIAASWMGKVKTVLQIGAVFGLILFDPAPLAVDLLVYVAVVATVISGFDYFFGLRRRIEEQRAREQLAKEQGAIDQGAGRPDQVA